MSVRQSISLCFCLLLGLTGYSKEHSVFGIVVTTNGKPVDCCIIKVVNQNISASSNARGEFSLTYDDHLSDSLIFYRLGFEARQIFISADTLKVILKSTVNNLDEVIVSSRHKGRTRHGVMGKSNLEPFGICTRQIGNESAIFLQANLKRHGQLEKIFFYITNEGIPGSRFRVHVYDIDTAYLPGNDLLDSVVILHANEGNEWVSVDISSRHITVGRGVFVSMEWISGYGNSEALLTAKNYPVGDFNGQVLSFTHGYHKQGSLYYVRRNKQSKWDYLWTGGSFAKWVLNPMIYATYTY